MWVCKWVETHVNHRRLVQSVGDIHALGGGLCILATYSCTDERLRSTYTRYSAYLEGLREDILDSTQWIARVDLVHLSRPTGVGRSVVEISMRGQISGRDQ